ncbi:hypothetical protein NDU88_006799 [Pleurodeles waltl]|uniref:Uncharacterized protein n=1 Tax=Pleurodeles waltl TaxID=8319 RepID=A0AAV7WEG1_PLEWA|nr:hypothetical protein NDU88_006799 [Pleurodeles waltl]
MWGREGPRTWRKRQLADESGSDLRRWGDLLDILNLFLWLKLENKRRFVHLRHTLCAFLRVPYFVLPSFQVYFGLLELDVQFVAALNLSVK